MVEFCFVNSHSFKKMMICVESKVKNDNFMSFTLRVPLGY